MAADARFPSGSQDVPVAQPTDPATGASATLASVLGGLLLVLACQLVGEFVVRSFGLPIPGPVLGMVLFLVWLLVRRPAEDAGEVRAADGLLWYLPLFFVPAGVGILVYLPDLLAQWLPVTLGLFLSWLVALLVTGAVATLFVRGRAGGVR